MSEKRGYPNPNYTEQDILPGIPLEVNAAITLDDKDYRELVAKAALFDLLTANIKSRIDYGNHYNDVDSDIVLALTGMDIYKDRKKAEKRAAETEAGEDE